MNNTNNRKGRLKSPKYRILIGADLREFRQKSGYSLSDVSDMTGIPINTVIEMEQGVTINIDYYFEFAKAVSYPFRTLHSLKIPLKPAYELSQEKKARTFLTRKIRKIINNEGFLGEGKTVDEIIDELVRLNLIEREKTSSKEVSGVMRNLIEDNTVEVKAKIKRKNIYVRFDG
ncbi:MAG TPA: helix-turn-helix transcriptional regulator [Gelidibacter sp.]|uniref:helix-turn-helix domain-containing protein n=1 Tax=Gelidibacter sp. TaxID=2018083 RepID=UPI002CA0DB46|nr:helix-turn-helix transcriptional regulator [Gelidibacter sp.]HXJ99723.1 helix-turn-helix transcriptional regulator [Gelidibacter sp.]